MINLEYSDDLSNKIYSKIKQHLTETDIDLEINEDGITWIQSTDGAWRNIGQIAKPNEIKTLGAILATNNEVKLNFEHPILDAYVPYDGARIHIEIPPVSSAPTLSLRIHREKFRDLDMLQNAKMFTKTQRAFLVSAVKNKRNIIISGETGSGKTTLLNALANEISPEERILTIEDTKELNIRLPNKTSKFTVNISGEQIIKSALRANPTRIIYGEVRDGAALDLIKAWNSAHKGGLATIHANSCDAVRTRLISLCGEVSQMNQEIAIDEALDIIVQIEIRDGIRKIIEIKDVKKNIKANKKS